MNSESDTSRATQRMARPDDPRALRSRESLRGALLSLVEEQPFEQISVRDITARAGVSYPVFFRRYATKEELLEDIATEQVRNLLSLSRPMFESDKQGDSLRALCAYVDEHRSLWTSLLTGGAAAAMRQEFRRIASEIGATREQAGDRSNPWLPIDLAASVVVSALFEILSWWLRQPADYPMENVITLIDALIVRPTARPHDVKLL